MQVYVYTKSPVNLDLLSLAITASAITAVLNHIEVFGDRLSIFFTSELSGEEQTILNGLVAAHNGASTPETNFVEVASTVFTQMNSSNYAVIDRMTSGPLRPGKYMVIFTGSFGSNAPLFTTPGIRLAVFVNGVKVDISEVLQDSAQIGLFGQSPIGMSTSCSVIVLEGQTVDIRWKNNGSGNTVSSYTRCLNLMKVIE